MVTLVQELIAIDCVLRKIRGVGPLLELLCDPCQEADGGVGEPIRQGLRAAGLDHEVAESLLRKASGSLEVALFSVGEERHLIGIAGRRPAERVQVQPDHVLWVQQAQLLRDRGSQSPARSQYGWRA